MNNCFNFFEKKMSAMPAIIVFLCTFLLAPLTGQGQKNMVKFEIWNWADLAYLKVLLDEYRLDEYDEYILMQDLGVPGQPDTYGKGVFEKGTPNEIVCPYEDLRKEGWYGYQNWITDADYTGGIYNNSHSLSVGGKANNPMATINNCSPSGRYCWNEFGWVSITFDQCFDRLFWRKFDGQNFTINGFWMDGDESNRGLFGNLRYDAIVQNLNINISDSVKGWDNVGALAGTACTGATITNCHVIGTGKVIGFGNENTGGLVGIVDDCICITKGSTNEENKKNRDDELYTSITYCSSSVEVIGTKQVGGLIGAVNYANIENNYATGKVTGTYRVGGFIGANYTSLNSNYATGDVKGCEGVGGLVGTTYGDILSCYATGNVTQTDTVKLDRYYPGTGGLAGYVDYSVSIYQCYATGTVSGEKKCPTGGLVGYIAVCEIGAKGKENRRQQRANFGITSCYALNPQVSTLGSNHQVGRIVGAVHCNNVDLSDNFALQCMKLNGANITTGTTTNNHGENILPDDAKSKSVYTNAGWVFNDIWTLDYTNYAVINVAGKETNLPILSAFSKKQFANAVQPPRVECKNLERYLVYEGDTLTGKFIGDFHWLQHAVDVCINNGVAYTIVATENDDDMTNFSKKQNYPELVGEGEDTNIFIPQNKIITLTSKNNNVFTIKQISKARHFELAGHLTLANIVLDGNSSNQSSGGITVNGGTLNIRAGAVIQNCFANYGGAVYLNSTATFVMMGGAIKNNKAAVDGGAIYTTQYSYANPSDPTSYANISIAPEAIFSGNTAPESFNPPNNHLQFTNRTSKPSFNGLLLNNNDINYRCDAVPVVAKISMTPSCSAFNTKASRASKEIVIDLASLNLPPLANQREEDFPLKGSNDIIRFDGASAAMVNDEIVMTYKTFHWTTWLGLDKWRYYFGQNAPDLLKDISDYKEHLKIPLPSGKYTMSMKYECSVTLTHGPYNVDPLLYEPTLELSAYEQGQEKIFASHHNFPVNVGEKNPFYSSPLLFDDKNQIFEVTGNAFEFNFDFAIACPDRRGSSNLTSTFKITEMIFTPLEDFKAPIEHICAGNSATFKAEVEKVKGVTYQYQWYVNDAKKGTNSENYTYFPKDDDVVHCVVTSATACPDSTKTNTITIKFDPTPIPPTVTSPYELCSQSGILTLADIPVQGSDIQWYKNEDRIVPLDMDNPITEHTIYWVTQKVNCCESEPSYVKVIINNDMVVPPPTLPSPLEFCSDLAATLTLADIQVTEQNLLWFRDGQATDPVKPTDKISEGAYYVAQTVGKCTSTTLTPVSIQYVENITTVPVMVSPQYFCYGATISDIVAERTDLVWYDDRTFTTPLSPSHFLESKAYYVKIASQGICENTPYATVNIMIDDAEDLNTFRETMCANKTLADLPVNGYGIKWYSDILLKNQVPETTEMEAEKTYYAANTAGGCAQLFYEISTYACYTLYGTVFPFVHDTLSDGTPDTEFNQLFKVTAKLYALPKQHIPGHPGTYFRRIEPLRETEAFYYDGKIHVPGTPLDPGKIGNYNNPGHPISWNMLNKPTDDIRTSTVNEGQIPTKPVGLYRFEEVEKGAYILALSAPGCVTRYAKIEVPNSLLGHRELIFGDMDNNGQIDQRDITIENAMKSNYGEPRYKIMYDVDKDRDIDIDDMKLLTEKYYGFIYLLYQETGNWLMGQ